MPNLLEIAHVKPEEILRLDGKIYTFNGELATAVLSKEQAIIIRDKEAVICEIFGKYGWVLGAQIKVGLRTRSSLEGMLRVRWSLVDTPRFDFDLRFMNILRFPADADILQS